MADAGSTRASTEADDLWVSVEEAIGLSREVGLGEEDLLKALRRGGVRSRGYFVPTGEEAELNPNVMPVPLQSEFWCGQGGLHKLWENPGIEDFEVYAEIQRRSLDGWIDGHLQRLARRHAERLAGKAGRRSPADFLRALHAGRTALEASLPSRMGEVKALVALQKRADPGGALLGPAPFATKNVIKLVFG